MTVRENLMMVPANQSGETLWNAWFRRGRIASEEQRLAQKADEVRVSHIDHLAEERPETSQVTKLLELGRTMMVDARIVFSMRSAQV